MLFYISDELISLAEANDDKAIVAIDNLMSASFYGKNIIYSSRNGFKRMNKIVSLSLQSKQVINKKLSTFSTDSQIFNLVTTYVNVTNAEDQIIKESNDKIVIKIPYVFIANDDAFCSKPILIGENLNDTDFYKYISRYFAYKMDIKCALAPSCESINGGGNTTHSSYKRYAQADNRICLCITDSDKKHISHNVDETAKKVQEVHNNLQPKLCMQYCIENVREVENLIPSNVLKIVCNDDVNRNKGFELSEIIKEYNPDLYLYFDFKDGLKCEKYRKIECQHLKPEIERLITEDLMLKTDDELSEIKSNKSTGVIISGMGSDLLSLSNEKLKDFSDWGSISLLENQEKEWITIGKLIFNYTYVFPKIIS